jgi:uridine kinase
MTIPRLVAITGGSGAGKSWLAGRLAAALGREAARLSLDDFYQDRSHLSLAQRKRINFDHPRAVDWPAFRRALLGLLDGRAVQAPVYDFTVSTRTARTVCCRPRRWIVVDGLWLLVKREIRGLFAHRVFLECPARVRLARRLERDLLERARTEESVKAQFYGQVEPMHQRFVEPQRRYADWVLPAPVTKVAVERLVKHLRSAAGT